MPLDALGLALGAAALHALWNLLLARERDTEAATAVALLVLVVVLVLPAALTFTLLGGVESLLSAKVADGMTGRKHRYNMELVAQGIANIASALFGGISVTGTIARTATNIRAGARSPISGSSTNAVSTTPATAPVVFTA